MKRLLLLGAVLAGLLAAPAQAGSLLVRFDEASKPSRLEQARLLVAVGGVVEDDLKARLLAKIGVRLVEVPDNASALEVLNASAIASAEAVGSVRVAGSLSSLQGSDPYLNGSSWQLQRPRFPEAWALAGDVGVLVAVLDSGVNPHSDLGALVPGYDFINGDADPADDFRHGTAVAGIINAKANGEGIVGACPSCSVLPVKVLGANGQGTWDAVAAGLVYAADQGAKVINLSLAASGAPYAVQAAVDYAKEKGAVVVAAAGNKDEPNAHYPAAYPGVLAVGAVNAQDARFTKELTAGHWGSNWGPTVHVAAAGCTVTTGYQHNGYTTFCGTSAAAPFVSGLVGLARGYAPDAEAGAIVDAVKAAAVAHTDFANGRVDALGVLERLPGRPPVPEEPAEPAPASTLTVSLAASAERPSVGRRFSVVARVEVEDADATGARLVFALPRNLVVSAPRGCLLRNLRLVCDLGDVAAGATRRVSFAARLRAKGAIRVGATVRAGQSVAVARLALRGR